MTRSSESLNRDEQPDTKFRKGKSGNPKGRPRRIEALDDPLPRFSAASIHDLLRAELHRMARVRVGDGSEEMPMLQAAFRAMATKAAKGDRLAAATMVRLMQQCERDAAREREKAEGKPRPKARPQPQPEAVTAAEEYKQVWSDVLQDAARGRAKCPVPDPHPDEVLVCRVQGTVRWPGSEPEEVLSLDLLAVLRERLAERQRRERETIDAMAHGYEKIRALCDWFWRDDLCRAMARHLPERYGVTESKPKWSEVRLRERAEEQRRGFEWEMAAEAEDGEVDTQDTGIAALEARMLALDGEEAGRTGVRSA